MVVSVVAATLLYEFNVLSSVVSGLYWIWSPMWTAAATNIVLRIRFKHAGIWRAQILDILDYRSSGAGRVRIVLGGDVGQLGIATFELKVDTEKIPLSLARGEPVELVLLSDRLDFSDFHLVKEAWLPWRRVWVAEETHIDRQNFEDLSRQLEEENFWRREE
eukprot:TRINITY_DN4208_c0_g1_i4.p1 TRINITY_DN4208_c0_g1~~TRINITY_DN4208_c0_g1_i4.p1  ORF type:complete len:162 (-),score=26.59 TRINITY_DN4208_c0_g1_i4:291-776(-)